MLTGNYTSPKIRDIATYECGLRTRSGKIHSRSMVYRIFTNPFYSGVFEYPQQSGNWYKGRHEQMITVDEYDRVQILLGRQGNPRPKKYNFAFRGLIRCGEYGASITPDEKNQIICSCCKYKFSSNGRSTCPNCKTPIEKMSKTTILHYLYYHCTKRKDPSFSHGAIEVKELEKQIDEALSRIQISEKFKNWALKYLKEENEMELITKKTILESQRRAYDGCLKKIENLFQLKISPQNVNGSLLSDEEYAKGKAELLREKARLEEVLNDQGSRINQWLEIAEKVFDFACHARYWFKNGSPEEKSQILQALSSDLTLKDKKLYFELKKPFTWIADVSHGYPEVRTAFEPEKSTKNELKLEETYSQNPRLQRALDEVRTWIMGNWTNLYLPSFN